MSTVVSKDIGSVLAVGIGAVFTPDATSSPDNRFRVVIRGWSVGSYILVEQIEGVSRAPLLRKGGNSALRFLHDGRACALTTGIVEWRAGPYTRLRWPETVSITAVRKNDRITAEIPCDVRFEDGMRVPAVVRDISSNGLAISAEFALEVDNRVFVTFSLPDGVRIEDTALVIKNVRTMGATVIAGCLLEEQESPARYDLEFFVASRQASNRGGDEAPRGVLIIDESDEARTAAEVLREKGYSVTVAPDVVDGFFSIRLNLPHAVLIAMKQKQASGLDVCRIIRAARGLGALPLFIYGGGSSARSQAADAGATGYVDNLQGSDWLTDIGPHLPDIAPAATNGHVVSEEAEAAGE